MYDISQKTDWIKSSLMFSNSAFPLQFKTKKVYSMLIDINFNTYKAKRQKYVLFKVTSPKKMFVGKQLFFATFLHGKKSKNQLKNK